MVLLIVGAIVETLAKHVTQNFLDDMSSIEIEGAPSWYMKPVEDQMCVFTHKKGTINSIEVAKKNAHFKMNKKINDIVEIVIYENMNNIKDKKEKELVDKFKKDENLDIFTKRSLNYSKISYEEEVKTAFVRACIPSTNIQEYQKSRLMDINEEVLGAKSGSAFDSLDDEFGEDNSNKKDKFDF